MNVKSDLIAELRKSKAWSQQHLSEVSNLSLRTIQRIEKSGKASNESIQSIAVAFGLEAKDLLTTEEPLPNNRLLHWKVGSVAASLVALIISLAIVAPASMASGIEVNADAMTIENETTKLFEGNVSITIPEGKEVEVNAKELWTSGDSTFVQGGVEIITESVTFSFEQGTLLKNGKVLLINAVAVVAQKVTPT